MEAVLRGALQRTVLNNLQRNETKQALFCRNVLHKLLQLSPRMRELYLLQTCALRHYEVNYKICQGGGTEKPC